LTKKKLDREKIKGFVARTMNKQLLLNLLVGVLLMNFCGMERAVGAEIASFFSSFPVPREVGLRKS
jgi:hypothetical protein